MWAVIEGGAIVDWQSNDTVGDPPRDIRPLVIQWPDFDKATHGVGNPTDTVEAARVVRTWTVTAKTLSKADLHNKATHARQDKVNDGTTITVAGVAIPVWTDFEAQASFTGAVVGSQVIGSGFAVRWKGRDGNFYTLDGAGMTELALGVMVYVNTQFGIEDAVHQAIDAGTITTTAQIDGAFQ